MKVTLDPLRGHFCVTFGMRRRLWGHFGISLGSVWVSVGDFGSLDGHFAIIVESLWVYEGPFSRKYSSSPLVSMIL